MSVQALGEAIQARLDELATITDVPGEITRLYLGEAHRRAANLVIGWMRDGGMTARLGSLGDVYGRYGGGREGERALVIGSHIDSVRNAGRYDGTLGVVVGVEIVRRLQAQGRRMPFPIDVIAFGDEEGVRFPTSLTGSRAVAGTFDQAALSEKDENGMTRREALAAFGCPASPIDAMRATTADTIGYVEVHIEQGPVLEANNIPVGVVTAINGCSRGSVAVAGWAGHAGTVPMDLRRDALAAAAEMVLAVEARAKGNADLVATVGSLRIPGGAINTVPGRVEFTLDVRSSEDARRLAALCDIRAACGDVAAKRGVTADVQTPYDVPAARCDAVLSEALARSAVRCGFDPFRLPSGAGHDAMSFRDALPFTMLFVRCRGGVSHNPAEFATIADMDAAARVLADFVENLAR